MFMGESNPVPVCSESSIVPVYPWNQNYVLVVTMARTRPPRPCPKIGIIFVADWIVLRAAVAAAPGGIPLPD
jgi:hypothetical protein